MNKTLILILLLILVGCEKKEPVDQDDLTKRNGLWYEKFSEEPYTGEMVDWDDNGNLVRTGNYLKGKRDGTWQYYAADASFSGFWNYNGSFLGTGVYVDGKMHQGYLLEKFPQISQIVEYQYKDGKQHGRQQIYNLKGVLLSSMCKINGLMDGYWKYKDSMDGKDEDFNYLCYKQGQELREDLYCKTETHEYCTHVPM